MTRILEIGCGENKVYDNSIGLDVRKTQVVDIMADACNLPFEDNVFDHVFSSHVIEHFSHTQTPIILAEWVRVLKPGGIFELRCPDLQARALIFFFRPNWQNVVNIYGEQDYPENTHYCGFSYNLLKQSLNKAHIIKIRRIIKGYKSIPFLPDCLHIKGQKSINLPY